MCHRAAATLGVLLLISAELPTQSNVLLIVADDMGVEHVGAYSGIGYTPRID